MINILFYFSQNLFDRSIIEFHW